MGKSLSTSKSSDAPRLILPSTDISINKVVIGLLFIVLPFLDLYTTVLFSNSDSHINVHIWFRGNYIRTPIPAPQVSHIDSMIKIAFSTSLRHLFCLIHGFMMLRSPKTPGDKHRDWNDQAFPMLHSVSCCRKGIGIQRIQYNCCPALKQQGQHKWLRMEWIFFIQFYVFLYLHQAFSNLSLIISTFFLTGRVPSSSITSQVIYQIANRTSH